jgi:hypothetical protein
MSSIFTKEIEELPTSPYDLIEPEIRHTKGKGVSRWQTSPHIAMVRLLGAFAFLILIGLYFLDPFLYSMHKSRAMRSYLYLKNYGDPAAAKALVDSGIFSEPELKILNSKIADFQAFFESPAAAQKTAKEAIVYMDNLNRLHNGHLNGANFLTHLRYDLFTRFGIIPPKEWESLNPDVETLSDATSIQPIFRHVETPPIHAY